MAIDPVTKLLLSLDIGDRTLEMAQRFVHSVIQILAPGVCRLPHGRVKEYTTALLTHFGSWVRPPRRQAQAPGPNPAGARCPKALCAGGQVLSQADVWSASTTWGVLDPGPGYAAAGGACWQITRPSLSGSTSPSVSTSPPWSRVITLCKHEAGIRQQLALYHVYYNFCLAMPLCASPFSMLTHPRQRFDQAMAARTPAMALA